MDNAPEFLNTKRRLYERFPSRFPVKYKDTRQSYGEMVQLKDVSAQGARITSKEPLYLNDSVSLEVALPDGKNPLTLRGDVVWSHKYEDGIWDAGLRFHKVVFMDLWRMYKSAVPDSAF